MLYCTNCGTYSTKKICQSCGSKNGAVQKFCGWCGNAIEQSAVKCPHCNEKLKSGGGAKFLRVIGVLAAIVLFFMGIGRITDNSIIVGVLFIVASLLLLPPVGKIIKNITFGNSGLKILFIVIRIVVILGVLIGGILTAPEKEPVEYKPTSSAAVEEALETFHRHVELKDEESFVLNDSDVNIETPYEGDANKALVTVYLDYSARNGFGGMNREDYTVYLMFDYTTGEYSDISYKFR